MRPGSYAKGDIVLANSPRKKSENIVKRLAAKGGDEVRYKVITGTKHATVEKVPEGEVWLQGDNAPASVDSRSWGCQSEDILLGRAVYQIWPRIRPLESTLDFVTLLEDGTYRKK